MEFWDVGDYTSEFIFEDEKRKLIENMDFLNDMGVEEQTLYKKWVELQEPEMIRQKYSMCAKYYDWQWKPTDIYNKELTIKEISELDPYVEIVEREDQVLKWTIARKMIHTMSWTANPGRNVKIFVIDRTSGKLLGLISLASDVTSIGARDSYIGWTKEDKFEKGKLNNTTIASTIVCTQPLGYNFLGGKLIAMMTTVPEIRQYWKEKYENTLIGVTTTSLYGIHSQYNGIPHFKTLGESTGKISIKPDDSFYEPWHQWLKENHNDWYQKNILDERARNGANMGYASGPVSGIKQKILGKIFKEVGINPSTYNHGFKRGIYFAQLYDNGNEFLRGEIDDSQLKLKERSEKGVEFINDWWKRKAISRYTKLHEQNRIKPEDLYYMDGIGIEWEEMKKLYLKEVGR